MSPKVAEPSILEREVRDVKVEAGDFSVPSPTNILFFSRGVDEEHSNENKFLGRLFFT